MDLDEVYQYNKKRWEKLAEAKALFTQPWLNLTEDSARAIIDPLGLLGDVEGKHVLCLAGGGGQQSAAFGLLGARVTVLDIAESQLERDRETAEHYGVSVTTVQGDMRNLRSLEEHVFDLVSQPYSLNFVPDCREVFAQVARVLRRRGTYTFMAANPFAVGIGTKNWNGYGYEIRQPYLQGEKIVYTDEEWVFPEGCLHKRLISGPREYRQLLSTLVNGLFQNGFVLTHLGEETGHEPFDDATPGSWHHMTSIIPPWLSFWARLMPEVLSSSPADN